MEVPHSQIWEQIKKKTKQSSCFHFPSIDSLCFGLCRNSVTGRILGCESNISRQENIVDYVLNHLPLPKTTVHYLKISPVVESDNTIRNIKIDRKMFYKPDDKHHFLFKSDKPKWICSLDSEGYDDLLLFENIFSDKCIALLQDPGNGFDNLLQESKRQMPRLVFNNVSTRRALPQPKSRQNSSSQSSQITRVRTDGLSSARQYE